MEPLKKYQVLTDESIFKIKFTIGLLEIFNKEQNNKLVKQNIEDLKAIIEDVQS